MRTRSHTTEQQKKDLDRFWPFMTSLERQGWHDLKSACTIAEKTQYIDRMRQRHYEEADKEDIGLLV